jgi:hypothetical protein
MVLEVYTLCCLNVLGLVSYKGEPNPSTTFLEVQIGLHQMRLFIL